MPYGSYSYGSTTYGGAIALAAPNPGNTKIRPKVLLRYGRINEPVRVPIYDLLVDSETTFLVTDAVTGDTTLAVRNTSSFAVNQIILIGAPGQEGSEIIKISSSIQPTSDTITLAGPLVYPHGANTTIYIINYDRIEYSVSQTLTGPKVVLGSLPIKADGEETKWNDNYTPQGYYFARWYNTTTTLFSPYSDGVPMISYTKYMARSIIQGALAEINKETSDVLTDEYGFQMLNLCQEEVLSEQKRWSFMMKFGTSIGQAILGQWRIPAPEDLPENQTNKFVYSFHIGTDPELTWIDKAQMDKFLEDVGYSTLRLPIYIGDASITLDSSGDMMDTGTVVVGDTTFGYSANNRATGVLTLNQVSTVAFPENSDVFQGAVKGRAQYWTSYGGYIYHWPAIDVHAVGRNYNMDYYRSATTIKTDTDQIVFPDAALAQYYLEWKFLLKLNKGQESPDSQAKQQQYMNRLTKMIQKNSLGRTFRLRPRMNNWAKQESFGVEGESERNILGNFPNV